MINTFDGFLVNRPQGLDVTDFNTMVIYVLSTRFEPIIMR